MDTDTNVGKYIDVEDALKRIGGNMGLYKRLLSRFLESDQYTPLEEALLKGDSEEAIHLAHTLKGVSANLSFTQVRTLSTELEQHVKEGSDYASLLSELKVAYAATVEEIKRLMS